MEAKEPETLKILPSFQCRGQHMIANLLECRPVASVSLWWDGFAFKQVFIISDMLFQDYLHFPGTEDAVIHHLRMYIVS